MAGTMRTKTTDAPGGLAPHVLAILRNFVREWDDYMAMAGGRISGPTDCWLGHYVDQIKKLVKDAEHGNGDEENAQATYESAEGEAGNPVPDDRTVRPGRRGEDADGDAAGTRPCRRAPGRPDRRG